MRTAFVLLAIGGLLATSGCNIGFSGEQGRLDFNYDEELFSGKKPLAVNSQITVNTYLTSNYKDENDIPDDADDVELTSVSSNNSSVIAVEEFGTSDASNEFVLAGKSGGTVDISVEATTEGGETVTDGFTMEAAPVERVALESPCAPTDDNANSKTFAYLTGHKIPIRKTLYGSGNQELIGSRYDPVTVSGPSKKATLAGPADDADVTLVRTGDQSGTVEVAPDVDGDPLTMEVHEEKAIDSISMTFEDEDDPTSTRPNFEVDGTSVCAARVDLAIDNETPDICTVDADTAEGGELLLGGYGGPHTDVTVVAEKKGTCKFEASVKQSSSGASTAVELDVDPSSGGS